MPNEAIPNVLEKHAQSIVSLPGVVGVAEGETEGEPCIVVYVAEETPEVVARIPSELGGWRVVVRQSGEFRALRDHL